MIIIIMIIIIIKIIVFGIIIIYYKLQEYLTEDLKKGPCSPNQKYPSVAVLV